MNPPDTESGKPDLRHAERRLAARSRELDALQAIGRVAAEAPTVDALCDAVVAALHATEELDVVLVAHGGRGARRLALHAAGPVDAQAVEALESRARRFLEWQEDEMPIRRELALDGHDPSRSARTEFSEEHCVLLPVVRRDRPVACLLAVPSEMPEESRLRLFYGATNQLSMHVDRIVSAGELESDRFRSIFEAMPQGVLMTDAHYVPLQINRAATVLLEQAGIDPGSGLTDAFTRLGLVGVIEQWQEQQAASCEAELRVADGRRWNVTVSRLRGAPAEPSGFLFVLSDVTDSRRLQEQLAQSEKMSSLGQMISGVAHELNNPLASVVGYAQLIRASTKGDEKLQRRLETLERESHRCRKIVKNLLSFARRRAPERKPLSLNQVVENVIGLLRYQLRVDGIRLDKELSNQLPAIEGDAHQLEQLLVNLLTNAAQAIRSEDETGRVVVRTTLIDGSVRMEIEDSGPGIPPELRSTVFDPFFTTKEAGEGTGLGLSLVYDIVASHEGCIEIVGDAPCGTTFRIELPITSRGEDRPSPTHGEQPLPLPSDASILVVDDDESLARMICESLSGEGWKAQFVGDGKQALARIEQESFDLLISDLKMPDMNGERLYRTLSETHSELAGRIVWTTGDTLGRTAEELARRTGRPVLHKPFDLAELRQAVRDGLTERHD